MNDKCLLFIGDAATTLKNLRSDYVDLIITSPPYDGMREYNGYNFTLETAQAIGTQCYRVLKPGGTLVWIVSDQTSGGTETFSSIKQALYFKEALGFLAHDTMVYHRCGPPQSRKRYEQAWEYMFVFTKGPPKTFNGLRVPKLYPEKNPRKKPKSFGRWRNAKEASYDDAKYGTGDKDIGTLRNDLLDKLDHNVWKPKMGRAICTDTHGWKHPAIFPEDLAAKHIHSWSNPGDVVLDPMMGSGTVGKMALQMGRKFIGIDCSPEYVREIVVPRLGQRRVYFVGDHDEWHML